MRKGAGVSSKHNAARFRLLASYFLLHDSRRRGFTPLEVASPSPVRDKSPLATADMPIASRISNGTRSFGLAPKARARVLAGFTLLEMIVSVGIFAVVIVASIGISLSIKSAQGKASNVQNVQDSIRYALEFMTKELRQGTSYVVSDYSSGVYHKVNFLRSFVSGSPQSIWYCWDSTAGVVYRRVDTVDTCLTQGLELTASNVKVTALSFYATGQASGSADGQPRITVLIAGSSRDPRAQLQASLILQTSVTQRARDL
ncbi:MAG: hypothetical protein A3H71_03040 [Candidatus Sungbacteria bacterium RIFCSPLOWO2_02_FULL_48_13b]|uniref:Prepilin-type N-terminal cleavage/methylation domain-containing protein n=2 Tax=Candidatus Sungiibacteriota TaxID=1817917 RepID=A0A1G2LL73_9BACT|nr:MAG: hypothetical protein A3C12_01600 [Candidatus Sungbacteria bacterium RIFCSPHIGHO2_02_FULL_49_20]OHA11609.1 MAG: hypothetical protein A3H71_03040 [Candidatus Sungbacteria bacterium RIFCSPLOWO2_02_FULL_48_13b]